MKSVRQFGLIGKTLKHSFSQRYFTEKFSRLGINDAAYQLYELDTIETYKNLVLHSDFVGLNVTIPYKREIIPYLDVITRDAKEIQAVNTIHFVDGKSIGYNTDIIGFEKTVRKLIGRRKVQQALVLGTGGASLAIQFVLRKLDISYLLVSRSNGDFTYEEVDKTLIENSRLIVNCTPVGTYPDLNEAPKLPYEFLSKKHLLYDLVYNPEKSLFLKYGESHGARILNGYEMLQLQAEAAWEIWNA